MEGRGVAGRLREGENAAMTPVDADHLLLELAKQKLRSVAVRLRRLGLARVAVKMSTQLLDDVRIAATEELAKRGLHVITHRACSRRKVA